MSNSLVQYTYEQGVAVIRLDDGKRNALSPAMFSEIYAAFDRAEADKAAVILTGRDDVFSAGFDLKVMKKGGLPALQMLKAGYGLTAKILEYPHPVVAACNGHTLAMGVFMLLACDYTIGAKGDFKISANEVALGLTMPRVAASMLHHRLQPAAYQRAVVLSHYFTVEEAHGAGFFDELATPENVFELAQQRAQSFLELDAVAHAESKRRIRRDLIRSIRRDIPLDLVDAMKLGLKRRPVKSKVG